MAHVNKSFIGTILKDLCKRMATITPNVFSETRPESVKEQMKELIVVSCSSRVVDMMPFQTANVKIEVMVRKKATGIANTASLDAITNKILDMMPISTSRYCVADPSLALKGSDQVGFNIWLISAKLTINTTDSYKYD